MFITFRCGVGPFLLLVLRLVLVVGVGRILHGLRFENGLRFD